MASQPSDRGDGDGEGRHESEGGLDAELDRAVPGSDAEAFLIGVSGQQAGRVYALSHNTVFLGRAPEADVFIANPSVSARHARIINGSHGFEIEDLDSTNGTFVGGKRVTRARLHGGDRVTVGQVEFNFILDRPVAGNATDYRPPQPCSLCNRCLLAVLEHPFGCYDERRYQSYDEMIERVMAIYRG